MEGFRLYTGNRLEQLVEKLAGLLDRSFHPPLTPEVIVVQSKGMERWLTLKIAEHLGIAMNIRFPFPQTFVEEAFEKVIGRRRSEAFTVEVMTWKIMSLIPQLLHEPAFGLLRAYAQEDYGGGGNNQLKLFQMASRVAWLFDQYMVFRPEMLAQWEQGKTKDEDEYWQSILWREIVASDREGSPLWLKGRLIEEIRRQDRDFDLPERLFIFGISTLPRFFLEIFYALSFRCEVHVFLMNPSREFWGDILSEREKKRLLQKAPRRTSWEDLHMEVGNPLLASWGILGKEFMALLAEFTVEEEEYFTDIGEDTVLTTLQADILHLRNRYENAKKVVDSHDYSVQIHVCHSPLREIEVLYDNLLALFEGDSELLPKDILVMAPEIEDYVPFIKAIFDRGEIPYSIADRRDFLKSPLISTFLQVFSLADGYVGATEVLSFLELPEVRKKFSFTDSDVGIIHSWVRSTGIRWGIDALWRRNLGLPPFQENTWQAGLSRLLMGYAVPGEEKKVIEGILPYDIEGDGAELLGRFLLFGETLFTTLKELSRLRTLQEWSVFLINFVDGFFAAEEEGEGELTLLRKTLLDLAMYEASADFHTPVDKKVIAAWLTQRGEERWASQGFLGGGVTFCSLLPMRSIPFDVIYLLGMNGDAYPRKSWRVAFDLLYRHPQRGDRSRRKDDRYLFLEALLSARKKFIISYIGYDLKDNSIRCPSVLVMELLDYLESAFILATGGNLLDRIVTKHRLQAVHPEYYRGGRLFSYSGENYEAAVQLFKKSEGKRKEEFFKLRTGEEWNQVTPESLVAFFSDPVRFLFERRLLVKLPDTESLLEDYEPLELGSLDKYNLAQELIERALNGLALKDYYEIARAEGVLPHDMVGKRAYRWLVGEVKYFVKKLQTHVDLNRKSTFKVDFRWEGFHLFGDIPLYDRDFVLYRFAELKPRDYLKAWINLLVLMAAMKRGDISAFLFGKNESWYFEAPVNGEEFLSTLLQLYREGIKKPLKFFPLSSWKYGESVFAKGNSVDKGLEAAAEVWRGKKHSQGEEREGEVANPLLNYLYGVEPPFDEEFKKTAELILKPLFASRRKFKEDESL